eukprot:6283074-Pyramimonas_sp.AAC.1
MFLNVPQCSSGQRDQQTQHQDVRDRALQGRGGPRRRPPQPAEAVSERRAPPAEGASQRRAARLRQASSLHVM